jgi:taurine dioxygenase
MTDLMDIARLEPFGVQIADADLTAPLGPAALSELAGLFHEHQILLFRGGPVTPRQYLSFVRQFGEPDGSPPPHPPVDVDGFTGLRLVSNVVEGGRAIGQFGNAEMGWHQDRWTDPEPPPATVLYGAEIPRRGGATSIASLSAAYDRLPVALKADIEARTIHFPLIVRDPEGRLAEADIHDPALFAIKPLVQIHPGSGRKALYLGARSIQPGLETNPRISGLARPESEALLETLFGALDGPGVAYRHDWRAGDLLLWDNRTCAHRREAFDNAERRLLYASPLVSSALL